MDLDKCTMFSVKADDRFPKKKGVNGYETDKHPELSENAWCCFFQDVNDLTMNFAAFSACTRMATCRSARQLREGWCSGNGRSRRKEELDVRRHNARALIEENTTRVAAPATSSRQEQET